MGLIGTIMGLIGPIKYCMAFQEFVIGVTVSVSFCKLEGLDEG